MKILFVYLSLVLIALLETYFDSSIWSLLSLIVFLWFTRLCLDIYRGPTAILFSFFFAKISMLVSLIAISNHLFIKELGIFASRPAHAAFFAILACGFMQLSCATATLLIRYGWTKPRGSLSPEIKAFTRLFAVATTAVTLLFLIATGLATGFPLLTHIDRFEYRADQSIFFLFVINAKPMLAALLGLARYRLDANLPEKRLIEVTMALLTFVSLLFGDKFGSLIVMAVTYFTPALAFDRRRFRLRPSLILAATLLLGLAGSMTYYIYSDYGLLGYDATMEKLLGRATGTGQLWYAASNETVPLVSLDTDQIHALINLSMQRGDTNSAAFDNHVGMFYMMQRYATTKDMVSIRKAEGGVQFTGATEAYIMLIGGIIPMILFLTVLAITIGAISFYMMDSLRDGSGIGVLVASYMLGFAYYTANQAAPWALFGFRTPLYCGILIAFDYGVRMLTRTSGRRRFIGFGGTKTIR